RTAASRSTRCNVVAVSKRGHLSPDARRSARSAAFHFGRGRALRLPRLSAPALDAPARRAADRRAFRSLVASLARLESEALISCRPSSDGDCQASEAKGPVSNWAFPHFCRPHTILLR